MKIDHDGGFVAHCFRCGWIATSRDGNRPPLRLVVPKTEAPDQCDDEMHDRLIPKWSRFWGECIAVRETLGSSYLQWRGCHQPPADGDLRFHPKAWHWAEKQHAPALVALLTDAIDRTPRSLHFTFLHESGTRKADFDRPRLLLGRHRKQGAIVRLWPDKSVTTGLGIGEGIETSLAGAHAIKPAWAAVDAGNLGEFPVLPGIESLVVFADHDEAGIAAARRCGLRWARAGREARIAMSSTPGRDLCDEVLNGHS